MVAALIGPNGAGGSGVGRKTILENLIRLGSISSQARKSLRSMGQTVDDGFALFASKAGASTNPDWYHNLRAYHEATIEVGSSTIAVTARVADSSERKQIWEKQKSDYPGFADYEHQTTRQIPVIILRPTGR